MSLLSLFLVLSLFEFVVYGCLWLFAAVVVVRTCCLRCVCNCRCLCVVFVVVVVVAVGVAVCKCCCCLWALMSAVVRVSGRCCLYLLFSLRLCLLMFPKQLDCKRPI